MNGIDFSLPDLGLAIAGFGAGGALLYSSRYVPGKYKAAPILGGMIGVALGGYYIYRAFVPQEIPPEPPDPQPGDVTATVLSPVNGYRYSCLWFYPLRLNLYSTYNQAYTIGVRAIKEHVDVMGEVIQTDEYEVAQGTLNPSPDITIITGTFKDKCYVPWITYRIKFQAVVISTGQVIGESETVEYTSAYI